MHTIGAGLKLWRSEKKLTQPEMATCLGMPFRTYQNYEGNVRPPNTEAWERFVRAGVNANWLLTGEGEMLLQDQPVKYETHKSTVLNQEQMLAGYVALPLYNNVHAAAGHGAVVGQEAPDDALIFKEEWLRYELGANPADLCLIRVSGDSMEPTLRAGEVILVDRRANRPDREGIYILRMGEMLLVKRLQAIPGGQVKVTSDNAAFDPWTLNLTDIGSEVAIVGRVVWSGRRH